MLVSLRKYTRYSTRMNYALDAVTVICAYCERRTLRHRAVCPYCGAPVPHTELRQEPPPPRPVQLRPVVLPTISRADQSRSYVYLISDGEYCKVGFAGDLQRRVTALQHASARTLTLVAAAETHQPRELERVLHGLLAQKHVRLEWYRAISLDEWNSAVREAVNLLDIAVLSETSSSLAEHNRLWSALEYVRSADSATPTS